MNFLQEEDLQNVYPRKVIFLMFGLLKGYKVNISLFSFSARSLFKIITLSKWNYFTLKNENEFGHHLKEKELVS